MLIQFKTNKKNNKCYKKTNNKIFNNCNNKI